MPTRDVTALLSLLSHELRAPAGVIGGYLAMLDRQSPPLTPDQQRSVDGARRAQQVMLTVLDDVRGLLGAWRDDSPLTPARTVSGHQLIDRVRERAAQENITVVREDSAVDAPLLGDVDQMATALASLAAAVAREHAADVSCTVVAIEGDSSVVVRLMPAGAVYDDTLDRTPFNQLRAGLGLRLPVAAAQVSRAGGRIHDLMRGDRAAGVDVELPSASR